MDRRERKTKASNGLWLLEHTVCHEADSPLVTADATTTLVGQRSDERPRIRVRLVLINREAELAIVGAVLADAFDGRTAGAVLVGPAGSGKTALLDETAAEGRA